MGRDTGAIARVDGYPGFPPSDSGGKGGSLGSFGNEGGKARRQKRRKEGNGPGADHRGSRRDGGEGAKRAQGAVVAGNLAVGRLLLRLRLGLVPVHGMVAAVMAGNLHRRMVLLHRLPVAAEGHAHGEIGRAHV